MKQTTHHMFIVLLVASLTTQTFAWTTVNLSRPSRKTMTTAAIQQHSRSSLAFLHLASDDNDTDKDDDGYLATDDNEQDDWGANEKDENNNNPQQPRQATPAQRAEEERDLFIPVFALVSLGGLFGAYAYEMIRLASRGELYLPWK